MPTRHTLVPSARLTTVGTKGGAWQWKLSFPSHYGGCEPQMKLANYVVVRLYLWCLCSYPGDLPPITHAFPGHERCRYIAWVKLCPSVTLLSEAGRPEICPYGPYYPYYLCRVPSLKVATANCIQIPE